MPDVVQFNRREDDPLAAGRFFEGLSGQGQGPQSGRANGSNTHELPPRLSIRASLVERDRHEEFLEFHFNPSSYKISRSAKWTETAVAGGTDTIEYTGCGLTFVTFTMLLNDLEPPQDLPIQRSTEDSLQWLYSRLRPRTEAEETRGGADRRRRVPWLNMQEPAANKRPPTLILFGLSQPFICVLADADADTVFQGRDGAQTIVNRQVVSRVTQTANFITRASVSIKLIEYVEAPAAGGEE